MKLLKKWRRNEGDDRGTALAKRAHGDWGLGRLRQEMDQSFDRIWRDFDRDPSSAFRNLHAAFGGPSAWPAIDMAEDDKAITLHVDVPGLDAGDVDVEVSGNLLTLRGQRADEWSDQRKGICRRERRSGRFARTVTLPSYADPEKIEARYDKGTLTVTVPKIPGKGPKRVQVKG